MATCPACGKELPGEFPFCPYCTAPLTEVVAGSAREERKVVTSLFCDLVGFTATSEQSDPEDVDRMLAAYFAVARAQIEGHGGIVEKFIGDAVLGLFGVPAAHEDDTERAVRAGLRIIEEAEQLLGVGGAPLRLRVGITTGEALVRLGVTRESGEGYLVGDAVNTAARIQSVAPVMGVAVGVATFEATSTVFDYSELEPATLKGKAEPVRVFHARAPLARLGVDLTRTHDSPYVGREIDLALLKGLFDKSAAANSVQLVTVVGEPGIGKSRIVAELLGHAQTQAPLLTWRQGRCLPYGDGVTFWALGEIVKAHAGILETDNADTAGAKLHDVVPDGVDRDWMAERLLPLVGLDVSSPAEREELFAAWRGFLETVAERSPTVLVFEDIHWADDAMLAFLEHLADRAEGVALLLVCTARPELFERTANFAGGLHNANRINLAPLSDEETARLVSASLDGTVLPDELRLPIVERAEGNPLYAEEFIRLLKDQQLLIREGDSWAVRAGAEVPLPGSIQALIAARLDTLPPERKALLSDAAVIGKVFWAGAVAEMGDRDTTEVVEALRELSRKELVRATRRSSMAGEAEYAFWHVLTRDVAYSQLPRPARATRHVAAATWLEAKAGERVEDIAEVLAHHYATALELTRAAGQLEHATELEAPALRFLTLAGEKALGLDVAAALASFARGLALIAHDHPARPGLQVQMAEAVMAQLRYRDAADFLEEAIATFEARGDDLHAADARIRLSSTSGALGDVSRARENAAAAVAELERHGTSEALARALGQAGFGREDYLNAEEAADQERAIAMAEALGLSSLRNELIADRALRRVNTGDRRGMDDLRACLVFAQAAGEYTHVARLYYWLSSCVGALEEPTAALALADEGLAFTRRRGMRNFETYIREDRLFALFRLGRWRELMGEADALIDEAESGGRGTGRTEYHKIRVLSVTGHAERAAARALEILETDRAYEYGVERIRALRAEPDGNAAAALESAVAQIRADGYTLQPGQRLELAREAVLLRRVDLANESATLKAIDWSVQTPAEERSLEAVIAEAEGRLEEAAAAFGLAVQSWDDLGEPYEAAMAELGLGRCLVSLGRPTEADQPLRRAREQFASLGAAPALAETDTLLQQASPLSA